MSEISTEALVISLLEQIRSLEEERDKALKLAAELSKKAKSSVGSEDRKLSVENAMSKVVSELQGIRLTEEQRQYNLNELSNCHESGVKSDSENSKTMLEMCKRYYGQMVSDLQEDKSLLQQKMERQQAQLLEKDLKIAELEMKLEHLKHRWVLNV